MKQAAANTEEDIPQSEITMDICDLNYTTTLVTNDNCAGETDRKMLGFNRKDSRNIYVY
jgi:hypothetical protein